MSTLDQLLQRVDSDLLHCLHPDAAWGYRILPLGRKQGQLHLAIAENVDRASLSDLRFVVGGEVTWETYADEDIEAALQHYYPRRTESHEQDGAEYTVREKNPATLQKHSRSEAGDERSTIGTVNAMITSAINRRASDIHIEPYETEVRVRFRIDGVLQEREPLDLAAKSAVISRLKIMADLDIAERRRPQDGRIRVSNGDRTIDIRVSTLPTDFGEKIVLRILDKGILKLDLNVLGLDEDELAVFKEAILSPYGMILATGPTGSGKTTTLYATLNQLNGTGVNILTIEDPIEYNLHGINQSHMRADIGFTFAKALKTFLRQDPDIIMVGEIRDYETAEIAVRAALTGHLVLSTLHTNDAPSAITRLVDMGVEPFLVASCVRLVIAQRLVRKICPSCTTELSKEELAAFDLGSAEGLSRASRGTGCKDCYDTGYRGRTGLYEVMRMTPQLTRKITEKRTAEELKTQSIRDGMRTLRISGIRKIESGMTSVEEVLRETRA